MITAFLEKDIFNDIIIYNDDYPNWRKILTNHAEVCLNITDDDLKAEEVPGTEIFEFIHSLGGKKITALSEFIEDIKANNDILADWPRAVFFFNLPKDKTNKLQEEYGVIVQSNEEINDTILKGSFFKDLTKNSTCEDHASKGWQNLINFPLPPSNAMVISDDYLFSNEESGQIVGKSNVINLINAFLPANINIPYHITIISNDNPDGKTKSKVWCEKLAGDLKAAIVALRPYSIVVEIVFTQTIHKRKLLLNYLNATTDKGFAVFKAVDSKTVRDDNDFRCDRIFNRIEIQEGDTDYLVAEKILIQLKQKCNSVKDYINYSGETTNYRILGDCNKDKSLNNRLINNV